MPSHMGDILWPSVAFENQTEVSLAQAHCTLYFM